MYPQRAHFVICSECTTLYNGTEEQSPGTYGSHMHDNPTNTSHRTEEEDINDQRQASQPSGQSTADLEDTDRTDRTNACLLENPMYAAGVIQQDDGGTFCCLHSCNIYHVHYKGMSRAIPRTNYVCVCVCVCVYVCVCLCVCAFVCVRAHVCA